MTYCVTRQDIPQNSWGLAKDVDRRRAQLLAGEFSA
jgi:hypothetical protein